MAYEKIPEKLKQVPRWVGWVDDKTPINPVRLCGANSTDSRTWGSFEQAAAAIGKTASYTEKTAVVRGVGFVLGDGWAGVDMDSHDVPLESGLIDEFMAALPTYTEWSRSGSGLHMIGRCGKTFTGSRKKGFPVEMYTGGRYFIMTGNVAADISAVNDITEGFQRLHTKYIAKLQTAPVRLQTSEISMDDREVIERAERSRTGGEFRALMDGDTSAYGGDHSAADQALCNRLAFWTGCNEEQMDRIFRNSGLMRDKWDRMTGGRTYGVMTVSKATEDCSDVYDPEYGRITAKQAFAEAVPEDVFGRTENETGKRKGPDPLEVRTAAELSKMKLDPPRFIINNLLPVGVSMLCAASKIGKSWMSLDMALSSVNGEPFMGFVTNPCKVMYFALEDSWFRLKSRLKKLTGSEDAPEGLTLAIRSENVQNGFMEQLNQFMEERPDVGLVIIDTFQKVKPPSDKNKTAYEQDYQLLSGFGKIAVQYNASVLFVHHTRKSTGFDSDPFEGILGSTALQGATDAMFVIKKEKRTDETATLYATGRDIEQHELCIRFDKNTCRWLNEGDVNTMEQMRMELGYRNHPIVKTIIAKLEEIEADDDEPVKEYVARIKDIRKDTAAFTGELVETSEKAFSTEMKKWILMLQVKNEICCIEPDKNTTMRGISARWYRFKKIP